MAIRKIRTYGDPVLREQAKTVAEITDEIRNLVTDMVETMYAGDGVGLAATQIGETYQIFVMDPRDDDVSEPVAYINPVIKNPTGKVVMEEGCLSIPGIRANVKRAESFDFEAIGLDGKKIAFRAEGLIARIILHEVDHLYGRLFVDYLSPVQKMMIKEELKKIEKMTKQEVVSA